MPTAAADDKTQRVREALEKAERIHAETMAKFDELKRSQMRLMESVLTRLAKERAQQISIATKTGSFDDISS